MESTDNNTLTTDNEKSVSSSSVSACEIYIKQECVEEGSQLAFDSNNSGVAVKEETTKEEPTTSEVHVKEEGIKEDVELDHVKVYSITKMEFFCEWLKHPKEERNERLFEFIFSKFDCCNASEDSVREIKRNVASLSAKFYEMWIASGKSKKNFLSKNRNWMVEEDIQFHIYLNQPYPPTSSGDFGATWSPRKQSSFKTKNPCIQSRSVSELTSITEISLRLSGSRNGANVISGLNEKHDYFSHDFLTGRKISIFKMNRAQLIKFVKLYRDAECLWKRSSESYKNRIARDEALKKISIEMNMDGFGVREVAQKIKNIRSAYYQELKKINKSKKPGGFVDAVYRPRVPWFPIVHSILKDSPEVSHIFHSNGSQAQMNRLPKESKGKPDPDGPSEVPPMSQESTSLKSRLLQEQCVPPSYNGNATEKLDHVQTNSLTETEFDVWCRSLAKQLNSMETWRALNVQMEIQSLVSKERISYEKEKSLSSSGNVPLAGSST